MTDPLFFSDDLAFGPGGPGLDEEVLLGGREGHHAAVVRRMQPGERVLIGDGGGAGVAGEVVQASRAGLRVRVTKRLSEPEPALQVTVVQALAKGDRAELAVEMLTEIGVVEIVPWQAARSIVRWSGERGQKGLTRWRATAREAAKQSRRLRIPQIPVAVSTAQLAARLGATDAVLHEDADDAIGAHPVPVSGRLTVVVGPEGGISPDELDAFRAAGARTVRIGPHVLRTSTAGVVAVSALINR